jgi:hypothetical protein
MAKMTKTKPKSDAKKPMYSEKDKSMDKGKKHKDAKSKSKMSR